MIEAANLTKRYGPFLAIDGVDFTVDKGEVAGFLGPNGAGKTTTLRIISCFMPPTAGHVRVAGHDTVRESDLVRLRIGYLPEKVPLYEDLRVQEYLRYRARLKGMRGGAAKQAVDRVIGRCALEPKRRKSIGSLSKGYRQRVGLADSLVHEPELLILDEPTSGLDPDQRIEVRNLITELGEERTVLLSTHILPEAEAVCDRVIIIHRGQIKANERLEVLREGRQQVRVRHAGPPLDYGLDGAATVTREGETTCIDVADPETASRLVAQAVHAERSILEVIPERASLERIFIDVTTGGEGRR